VIVAEVSYMFGILERIFFYQCSCCDKRVAFARYTDGAYQCLECSRGEHRHAGLGSKAA
jgi:ribosomal protein L37AE/L43A